VEFAADVRQRFARRFNVPGVEVDADELPARRDPAQEFGGVTAQAQRAIDQCLLRLRGECFEHLAHQHRDVVAAHGHIVAARRPHERPRVARRLLRREVHGPLQ
jgi:hypothetical protein